MKTIKPAAICALVGALALGLAGCPNHEEYRFDGKRGRESVEFSEWLFGLGSDLVVTKANGETTRYIDSGNDGVEIFCNTPKGEEICYDKDSPGGEKVLRDAQEQFDRYQSRIILAKKKQENL